MIKSSIVVLLVAGLFSMTNIKDGFGAEPFAVVELFSSEGCSSCPPTDELLSAITEQARSKGQRIFTLSYQVDYWDYLGWKDPYSRPEFTRRQNAYAQVLGETSVYTPQMVINGRHGFVGTDARKAQVLLLDDMVQGSGADLMISVDKTSAQGLVLNYDCQVPAQSALLNVAMVQDEAVSQVTAGENQGRVLRHSNIVRALKTVAITSSKGSVGLDGFDLSQAGGLSLVVYIQTSDQGDILAAESVRL